MPFRIYGLILACRRREGVPLWISENQRPNRCKLDFIVFNCKLYWNIFFMTGRKKKEAYYTTLDFIHVSTRLQRSQNGFIF